MATDNGCPPPSPFYSKATNALPNGTSAGRIITANPSRVAISFFLQTPNVNVNIETTDGSGFKFQLTSSNPSLLMSKDDYGDIVCSSFGFPAFSPVCQVSIVEKLCRPC